jgi:LemA protein
MWIVIVLIVLIGLYFLFTYNALVTLRERVTNAWSQIEVQLRRRYDLIPNLVNTVKGYATHESSTFEKITQARANAIGAQSVSEQAQAENQLSGTLKSLFAVAESYPELKADSNFKQLQLELTETEGKIAFSRQFYNDTVQKFNTKIKLFPNNLVAGIFNFSQMDYFNLDEEAEARQPVTVSFD